MCVSRPGICGASRCARARPRACGWTDLRFVDDQAEVEVQGEGGDDIQRAGRGGDEGGRQVHPADYRNLGVPIVLVSVWCCVRCV